MKFAKMKPKEILGRLFGQFRRGWQRFNAENRAFRELDKQKTHHVAAPKYPVNLKYLEDTAKESAEYTEKQNVVDKDLGNRLKKVFVSSEDPEPIVYKIHRSNVEKPLPMSRRVDHHELGFQETLPENVPVGKISLRSALQMINDHRVEPAIYTIEASAEKYKMNLDLTRNIMRFFRPFELNISSGKIDLEQYKLEKQKEWSGMITPETTHTEVKQMLKEADERRAKEKAERNT